jgi:Tol biopolymer transport system component/tRNA A-37 threonylcarbamoyl transferase component Bud32
MAREDPKSSLVGRQIGSYHLLSLLGTGGMGEVYRARDSKLGREVAIKVLPSALTRDPDRLARFAREARLQAALNHPHIAAIYELVEAEDLQALVLELVEGPTLAERVAKGPVSIKETLVIARQIAEALEVAHEKGIIHRDLKPANIKLTADGNVKVLDFGLAKFGESARGEADSKLLERPTMTFEGTEVGLVLGSAPYMSPEQARGQAVDKRSDIWAFGCVLFELLTGRAVFLRDTIADTLAAVLEGSPDWDALPAATPESIVRLLPRCLEKDPRRRLRDIGDTRIEIEEAAAVLASPAGSESGRIRATRDRVSAAPRRAHFARWAAAAVSLVALGVMVAWYIHHTHRSVLPNPFEGATFTKLTDFEGAEQHAAISRDGKFVAFLSDRDGKWDIWVTQVGTGDFHNLTNGSVQELRNPEVRELGFSPDGSLVIFWRRRPDSAGAGLVDGGWAVPTLGGPLRPYLPGIAELDWSPDGSRIVYHTPTPGDSLFVTEAGEKSGQQIYSAKPGVHNHFPLWSSDAAFIYFVQGYPPNEMDIWRIRPTGGEPERLTFHIGPVSFPILLDNRTILYLATAEDGSGPWIHELDVERRVTRRLSTGVEEYESLASSADGRRLVATVSGGVAGLWRVPIADRVAHESEATRLALPTTRGLSPRIGNGFVLYRAPKAGTDALWRVQEGMGTELWNGADGRVVAGPAIAPDGRSIAFPVQKQGMARLYVTNADGTGARRLAEELDVRGGPAWSPDGQWIAIAAIQDGEPRLYKIPVHGGTPVRLTDEYSLDPLWSPSNRFLVYSRANVGATFLVKAVTPEGAAYDLPELLLSRGSRRMDFLGGGDELVVMKGDIFKDFWAVDLRTGRERQLTDLGPGFTIADFDVSPDGREILFDRARDESDIVLIDLASH